MTSTAPHKPKKRRLLWLFIVIAVVFAVYSAGWFYFADKVRAEAANTVAALNAKGINADCANLAVTGYPVWFEVSCDNAAYEDDARNVAVSTGGIRAVAPFYKPFSPTADITGPLRTTAPGMVPLWLDWDRMHLSTGLSWPVQQRVTLQAEGFSGQTDPQDETDPVQLFSAGEAAAQLRPDGQNLVARASFSDLLIEAEAIGGRTLPPLEGTLDATVTNGMALLSAPVRSLRGQSLNLDQMVLSSGKGSIQLSGPLSVDADGMIDADLMIRIKNPQAVSAMLGTAIPEQKRQIEQGFAAIMLLGKEPTMPLKIIKGRASLGFIPFGKIGPLQ